MGKGKKQGVSIFSKIPACSKHRAVMLTGVTRDFVIGMNIFEKKNCTCKIIRHYLGVLKMCSNRNHGIWEIEQSIIMQWNLQISLGQGVTKRTRLSWLTNSALVYEPKDGGRGELRGLCQWVQMYTGAQTNIGDLTPYLTYGMGLRG